ncbi:MAG TPA: hypothetical protein VLC09_02610, partial [Polyangiaceae bacterium]|nr:hypothetical protein [Polyangiaceae bacterium]
MFPGITLLVGVFLTWTGQQALRESNLDMARTRLNGRSRLVTTYLTDTLQTAEPILDDLTEKVETWAPDTPLPTVAEQTRQLLRGTQGVCFVSVSFEDGSFRGSFTQPDGTLHFLSTRVTPEGTRVDQFDFAVDGSLVAKSSTKGTFDPRQRPYYDSAVQADGRVWTEPYPFHPTERMGVARAQAVFRPNVEPKQLQAVVTVGFDVASLSRLLDHSTLPQQRPLLYTGSGQILAFSGGAASSKPLLEGSGSIGIADLSDDVATGYFKELELAEHDTSELPNTSTRWLDFSLNGSAYLAAEQRVGTDPEFDWHLAQVVPESVFLTSLESYSRQGYWVSGGAVFLALLGSFGFAQLVVRMRNATVRAQDRAREAVRRAQELGSYQLLERLG